MYFKGIKTPWTQKITFQWQYSSNKSAVRLGKHNEFILSDLPLPTNYLRPMAFFDAAVKFAPII